VVKVVVSLARACVADLMAQSFGEGFPKGVAEGFPSGLGKGSTEGFVECFCFCIGRLSSALSCVCVTGRRFTTLVESEVQYDGNHSTSGRLRGSRRWLVLIVQQPVGGPSGTALKRKIADVAYAAEVLQVPRYKVYRMLKRGKLPGAFMTRGVWRVDIGELERFLEAEKNLSK
jgi:excisionase family DNA binding protein